jgi:RHS repeat-associated protein
MSYVYDTAGSRVIREKWDGLDATTRRQDLYLGGYERRQVQMRDSSGTPQPVAHQGADLSFYDLDDTRTVLYASSARMQWDYDESLGGFERVKIFLTFKNHLGSTSAVVDYLDGTLVEWTSHYAYGAEESHWKNLDDKYDNAEEPYGFTGKEEDKAIGLHYFGARYYSAYLGRWLSPDPPMVHSGTGVGNYFGYAANSPYIAVDPDGNFVNLIVGAIGAAIGAVAGFVSGMVTGGWENALVQASIGAAAGFISGVSMGAGVAAAMAIGAAVGAASAFGSTYASARFQGMSMNDSLGLAGKGAGWGALGGAVGGAASAGVASQGWNAIGTTALQIGINQSIKATLTVPRLAVETDGDLSEVDWDEYMKDYGISSAIEVAASVANAALVKAADNAGLLDKGWVGRGANAMRNRGSSQSRTPAGEGGGRQGGGLGVGPLRPPSTPQLELAPNRPELYAQMNVGNPSWDRGNKLDLPEVARDHVPVPITPEATDVPIGLADPPHYELTSPLTASSGASSNPIRRFFLMAFCFVHEYGAVTASFSGGYGLGVTGIISATKSGISFTIGGGVGIGFGAAFTSGISRDSSNGWAIDFSGSAGKGPGGYGSFGYNFSEGQGYAGFGGGLGLGAGAAVTGSYTETYTWDEMFGLFRE